MKTFSLILCICSITFLISCKNSINSANQPPSNVPMWTKNGFPKKMVDTTLSAGMAHTIKTGPYTVNIPSNAFKDKVQFQVLSGDTANFMSMAPMGQIPILAFAFQVKDLKTNQYLGMFNNPVNFMAKAPSINPESKYYNISKSGSYTFNSKGMQNGKEMLSHPIAGDGVGWVITKPAVPNYEGLGFADSVASVNFTPGKKDSIKTNTYDIQIPSDAFKMPVRFVLLTGKTSNFSSNAPSGEKPVLAFAFKVVNTSNGQLVGKFNKPVMFKAMSSSITSNSKYYNISPNGMYTNNPKGMTVKSGELTHPIAGAPVGWVITSPN